VVLGVIGIFFSAAGIRTTLALPIPGQRRRSQFALIAGLLVTFGFELAFAIALVLKSHRTWAVSDLGDVLIVSVLIGIARAWELVGNWDTGVLSSIALLAGRQVDVPAVDVAEPPAESGHRT
jgi:hypothetical protein